MRTCLFCGVIAYKFRCGLMVSFCVSKRKIVPSIPQLMHFVPLSVKSWIRVLLRNLFPSGSVMLFWFVSLSICSM